MLGSDVCRYCAYPYGGAEVVFTPTYTRTYTFGVGPEDVKTIFGPTILNGVTYYQVFLDTVADS